MSEKRRAPLSPDPPITAHTLAASKSFAAHAAACKRCSDTGITLCPEGAKLLRKLITAHRAPRTT